MTPRATRSSKGNATRSDLTSKSITNASTSSNQVSKKSTPSEKDLNLQQVRRLLEKHQIYIDKSAPYETSANADFKAMINGIVMPDKTKIMSDESAKKARCLREKYSVSNESTFVPKFLPTIVKEGRIRISPPYNEDDDSRGNDYDRDHEVTRIFEDDGLVENWNQQLLKNMVPIPNADDGKELSRLLAKAGHITNPKPDIVYGVTTSVFETQKEREINDSNSEIVEVSPGMLHPFFLMEWKSAAGSLGVAENQAGRAGAALVNARRKFNERLGQVHDSDGPDWDSFVFSCTAQHRSGTMWVNWCERKNRTVSYHMNEVFAYRFTMEDDLKKFRCHINNILEWGLEHRIIRIKEMMLTKNPE